MTLAENLVKTILPEFLTYLDKLEKGEIVEKELDINKNPSIHSDVNKALDVGSGSVSGNHHRAKGVHRRLDDHVGQREQAALDAGRQAYLDHLNELVLVDADGLGIQVAAVFPQGQAANHQHGRNHLGCHSSDGHAGHTHVEEDHSNQVEHHVDDA